MAITKQDVFKAADELSSQGTNPTQSSIRDYLKGGSFSTISPWLKEWKKEEDQTPTLQQAVPTHLQETVNNLAQTFWSEASKLAETERKAFQEEAQGKINEAQSELKEALDEIRHLESVIEKTLSDLNKEQTERIAYKIEYEKSREKQEGIEKESRTIKRLNESLQLQLETLSEAFKTLAPKQETSKKETPEKCDRTLELSLEETNQDKNINQNKNEKETPLTTLDWNSHHIISALAQHNINTIEQLTCFSFDELKNLGGIGVKMMQTINDKLRENGLTLRRDTK